MVQCVLLPRRRHEGEHGNQQPVESRSEAKIHPVREEKLLCAGPKEAPHQQHPEGEDEAHRTCLQRESNPGDQHPPGAPLLQPELLHHQGGVQTEGEPQLLFLSQGI